MIKMRPTLANNGFSLAELMVVVAVIGILSGISISISGNEWRRERVNAVAIEFAGWLEQIRGASLREVNSNPNAGGCAVTLLTPLSGAAAGSTLASVTPASCSPSPTFIITSIAASTTSYTIQSSNGTSIMFTPRGTVITNGNDDISVNIFLNDSSLLRCVTVGAILGGISIGSNQSATASSSCTAAATRF